MAPEDVRRLLAEGEFGVLSTCDLQGRPYGVPLHYVYHNRHIYFHCAPEGHKLENLRNHPWVSFCVVGWMRIRPEELATEYESVVLFGRAVEIQGQEKLEALRQLVNKYAPTFIAQGEQCISKHFDRTTVVRITVEQLTGKIKKPIPPYN